MSSSSFDEIDAIASNRATDGETSDVMAGSYRRLLNEWMDGVSSGRQANVVVVAYQSLGYVGALVRLGHGHYRNLLRDAAHILQLEILLVRVFARRCRSRKNRDEIESPRVLVALMWKVFLAPLS
jgi:hypothetical protein